MFSTKERLPLITDPAESWKVLCRVAAGAEIHVCAIGGTSKHVHLLLDLPSTCTIADVVRKLKANSSARFRRLTTRFAGQGQYDAISVRPSTVQSVISYISHQPEHYSRQSFEDEYLAIWNGRA